MDLYTSADTSASTTNLTLDDLLKAKAELGNLPRPIRSITFNSRGWILVKNLRKYLFDTGLQPNSLYGVKCELKPDQVEDYKINY